MLDTQNAARAFSRARLSAGKSIAARIPMMAITTNNSISVKAGAVRLVEPLCERVLVCVTVLSFLESLTLLSCATSKLLFVLTRTFKRIFPLRSTTFLIIINSL